MFLYSPSGYAGTSSDSIQRSASAGAIPQLVGQMESSSTSEKAASPRRLALAIAILALPAAPIPALAQAQFVTGPYVAGGAGVWMFYVQHQFEGVYWERGQKWDYAAAALQGSSFYKLPVVLQWFSGNIGFHHIHHLGSKIPNYNLPKAYKENAIFHIKPLTLRSTVSPWYTAVPERPV